MYLFRIVGRFAPWSLAGAALALSACNDMGSVSQRSLTPIPPETLALMEQAGVAKESPTLIRAYKKEAEFEVWKQRPDGRYAYLKTFPMCRWSGQLGPKVREGDRQVPEGFYSITPGQMNPNSAYYLSFNVGYPNAYDRAYGHSGGSIMVHGACSSAGCFSMTDRQISEIYAILRTSFNNGQRSIQMQSYPFKMTAENLAKHRLDPNIGFWKQLKEGSDHFEIAGKEPAVGVCGRRYVFDAVSANGQPLDASASCPPLKRNAELEAQVAQKASVDNAKVAELASAGVKPVRIVYQDGGQHPDFYARVAEVSRPETLVAPVEIALEEKTGAKARSPVVAMAATKLAAKAKKEAEAKVAVAAQQTIATPAVAEPTVQEPSRLGALAGATDSIGGLLGFHKEPAATPAVPPETASAPVPAPAIAAAKTEMVPASGQKTAASKAPASAMPKANAAKPAAAQAASAAQGAASQPAHGPAAAARKPQAAIGAAHAKIASTAVAPALRDTLAPQAVARP